MRIHVVADATENDSGHVGERLLQRGADLVIVDRDDLPAFDTLGSSDLVLLLGSDKSAHDERWIESVTAEVRLIRASLAAGVPVMGICYGVQVLARALGGTSWRSELGWQRVDTLDPVLCPEGPWGQMHKDVFSPGPTSRVIGSSWRGPQCIVDDSWGARAIGWQFHPEVTAPTYERWVAEGYYGDAGDDPKELVRQANAFAASTRNLAHALTDAALDYLRVAPVVGGVA